MNHQASALVIYAKDYKKLAQFYSAVLQLEITEHDHEFILMASEGFELVILQAPASITQNISINDPPTRRENTPIKPVFFVNNLQTARNLAKDNGGFVNDADKAWIFNQNLVCDGYDPEGNIFQLRASHIP
ncbi:MAG: VOC family protein [Cyanobacteria bacterium P01_A01_bin.123]